MCEGVIMRVAIVGTGRMGEAHARAWAALAPEVEVAAAVGHGEPRPLASAPGVRVTTDLDGVLSDPSIGIVSICTPTDTHLDLTARALGAGKHVLLEKPLARSVADGVRLVQLGERGPGLLMVAHVVRFFPAYVAVRDLVEQGALGTVREVRADRLSPEGGRPGWVDDDERSGGFLVDLAVHDFDQLLLLLGRAQRVHAVPAAERTAEVTVEHEGGGLGRVRAGWDLPASSPFRTLLEVTGDRGRARATGGDAQQGVSELEVELASVPRRTAVDAGEPYTAQARYFLECVRTGSAPRHGDPAASLAALRLALAARTALLSGTPVDLP
jgi:predicted dehydrogenase